VKVEAGRQGKITWGAAGADQIQEAGQQTVDIEVWDFKGLKHFRGEAQVNLGDVIDRGRVTDSFRCARMRTHMRACSPLLLPATPRKQYSFLVRACMRTHCMLPLLLLACPPKPRLACLATGRHDSASEGA
jgi:hypothetical protein